jgi:hypothetical protein
MAQKPAIVRQVIDLRLQFFPTTTPVHQTAPDRTRLVEVQSAGAIEQIVQPPSAVQCNCACK